MASALLGTTSAFLQGIQEEDKGQNGIYVSIHYAEPSQGTSAMYLTGQSYVMWSSQTAEECG